MKILFLHFAVLLTLFSATAQSTAAPNIIFILTDDQRWDAIGASGNKLVYTPQMDKLAEEGVYFSQALVTTPICAASRASILSGLQERTHRFNFQAGDIPKQYMDSSYPKLLKDAGYTTGFYGKYGIKYPHEAELFDEFDVYDRNKAFKDRRSYVYKELNGDTVHLTRYTGQQALDFIERRKGESKPFCLSLSFSAPHAQDNAPDQYFWQNATASLLSDAKVPPAKMTDQKYFDNQPKEVREGFNRLRWTWRYDNPEKYQHSVKGYYRMIAGIDLEIGKIRAKLLEQGLDKNTVIIVMGDNGYFMGERQLAGKWLMYDNSIRVPLIVYDPRAETQKATDVLALNTDIAPTIASLAGVKAPASWQGKPLVVNGKAVANRDTVLIEHLWDFDPIPPSEGVRTKQWKYFRYVNDQSWEELYDLKKDPLEKVNLAKSPKHNATLLALRTKTDELVNRYSDEASEGPTGLHIEYIRDPRFTTIYDTNPEFGWHLSHEMAGQMGYQILVATSKQQLKQNNGDVWDSGHVMSSNSTMVEFGGNPLAQGKTYYWKVRVWDSANRLTRYSAPQRFTIGTSEKGWTTSENWFLNEYEQPVSTIIREDGAIFYDYGKAAFGTLEIDYTSTSDDSLTIRLGEKLEGDTIDMNPGGHIRFAERRIAVKKGTHTYPLELIPDKRNTLVAKNAVILPDSFEVVMPFRYAEVYTPKGVSSAELKDNVKLTRIAYYGYWDENRSSFSSSDDTLNQVWEMCRYSIKMTTFSGLYVDGDRERIPYEADAYLEQLSHYTTDQEYAMARQTIEYFMEHPTWPTEWQQHVALMFYADYMYTGNLELVERFYEPLKVKTLMALRDPNGLVTSDNSDGAFMKKLGFKNPKDTMSDIVDWPPPNWGGDPNVPGERDGFVFEKYNTVINALYYENMRIMAEFAKVLGKTEDMLEFEFLAAEAKRAVNELLFDKAKGRYKDGVTTDHASIHANMFPLAFGMVPDAHQASVVEHIKSRGLACSVYGSQYLLDGLYRAGEADYALDLMRSTDTRSWYNMIREGSTVSMEAWGFQFKPNQDWNHAWGAVPANAIPRRMWGIQPKTPGFGVARIQPQMSDLKQSTIRVPTIMGDILGSYSRKGKRITFALTLPAGMVGEFVLPKGQENVEVNGRAAPTAFGNIRLFGGESTIVMDTMDSF